MTKHTQNGSSIDAARFAIVVSRFNKPVTEGLLRGAQGALHEQGAKNITVFWCPGAFEIPLLAQKLANSGSYDAIITLGAVIKGETYHFEVISDSVVDALQRVALDTNVPVCLGILTPYNANQALYRSDPARGNKGAEAAKAAIEMVRLLRQI